MIKCIDYMDLKLAYYHELGHKTIFKLFHIESKIKVFIIRKPRWICGDCSPINNRDFTELYKFYILQFLHFLWDCLWLLILINKSWLNYFKKELWNSEFYKID